MSDSHGFWDERTICDVLEEMRTCIKTLQFGHLLGLIEEVQGMGRRMEAKLNLYGNFERAEEKVTRLKMEIRALAKKKRDLTTELGTDGSDDG